MLYLYACSYRGPEVTQCYFYVYVSIWKPEVTQCYIYKYVYGRPEVTQFISVCMYLQGIRGNLMLYLQVCVYL
jgi:hypothetical protein